MKQMFLITTPSAMDAMAKKLSRLLSLGMVITLSGSLGSGKTTLVQSLAKYLGVTSRVISPTFTLMKMYQLPQGRLLHVDAYRLDTLQGLGLDDETGDDTITMIEWPEKITTLPEGVRVHITITIQDDQTRLVTIEGPILSFQV
jgi:tRNA threonylcarbamoyladenosine biosynthesis protein TsaE